MRERERWFLMVVGPRGQKLHELGTPCPEYPGLRSEYPGRVLHNEYGFIMENVYVMGATP